MDPFRIRFIIGKLSDAELECLKKGETLISKMILIPDDYRIFRYQVGDEIQVETQEGNRIWTTIKNMEIVEDSERIIIIFSLVAQGHEDTGKSL